MAPDTWSGIVTAAVSVVTIVCTGGAGGIIAVYRVCQRLRRMEEAIVLLLQAAGINDVNLGNGRRRIR